jgi:hypothetical protein
MPNNASQPDDLEAVRMLVSALKDFSKEDQERIIRWTQEKLSLTSAPKETPPGVTPTPSAESRRVLPKDIKSFISQKKPRSDIEFAATVAYFYRFEVPESERKNEITTADIKDAARKAPWAQKRRPSDTLNNAVKGGLLDSGSKRGTYKINAVGENLVAMTLPSGEQKQSKSIRPRVRKRSTAKK